MSNPFDQFDEPKRNPFDQFDPVGTFAGIGGSLQRGLKTAGQAVDALTLGAGANLVADAAQERDRVAAEELADPMPKRENFAPAPAGQRGYDHAMLKWQERQRQRADRLAGAEKFTGEMTQGRLPALASAIDRRQRETEALPRSEAMQAFDAAEGWKDTLKALAKNPVEVITNLAVEGLGTSTGTLALGTLAVPAGPAGIVLATGAGSMATEYGNKLVEEIRSAGADFSKPETVVALLQDSEKMAEIRDKAFRRGVPVAFFDAASAGFAGRLFRQPAKTILGKLGQGAAETAVQGAAGGAGEVAGSVAAGDDIRFKDVLAEVAGEMGTGTVEVARGVMTTRDPSGRESVNQWLRERAAKPAAPAATSPAAPTPPQPSISQPPAATTTPTANLDAEISATLPDAESVDVLKGRSTQALERQTAGQPDFAEVVRGTVDDLLTTGLTADQLKALDFNLRFLLDRKEARRLTTNRVNAALGPVLDRRVPAERYFTLVEQLAKSPQAIEAFRTELRRLAEAPAPTPVAAPPATPASSSTTSDRAALQARLRQEIEARAAQEEARRAATEQARAADTQARQEQTERIRAENARLRAIERTGRDPETREIADLTKLPNDELDTLDIEAEGLTMQQLDAELERRARLAEERQARTDQGESLRDALAEVKLPASDAALGTELRMLREEMQPAERMRFLGGAGTSLDATAQSLRERGFSFIETPADVIDYAQRVLRGEDIRADRAGEESAARFTRRAPRPAAVTPQRLEQWWDETFRLMAPGVARDFGLAFGSPEALADAGMARRAELTGQEEAAYVAHQRMFYLFDRALRENPESVTRLNLLHEIGHAYYDTLDLATRQQLFTQWRQEMESRTGPLFTDAGELRPDVALGVDSDVHEWFAERMAHANDAWAKRRMDALGPRDGLIRVLAAELRALLLRFREFIERAFGLNGYNDTLARDFRAFLDQGEKFAEPAEGARPQEQPAPAFARRGEARELRTFLDGPTIASVAADALPTKATPTELRSAILRQLRPAAHPELGEVAINQRALRDTFSHGLSRPKILASLALPDVIEQGQIVAELPPQYKSQAWIVAAPVEIAGKHHIVAALVKRAHDSQRLYVHEAFLTEKLQTPDFKTGALQSSGRPGSGGGVIATVIREALNVNPEGGRARFASRTPPPSVEPDDVRTPEQNLRDYAALERQRDRVLDEEGGMMTARVHALNRRLSELRMALENTMPGWRDRLKAGQVRTTAEPAPDAVPTTPPAAEPVQSEETVYREMEAIGEPGTQPREAAAKHAHLEASTLRRPSGIKTWFENFRSLLGGFRGLVPELPSGAEGREFTRFRQGLKKLNNATEITRKEAEDEVLHVLQPLRALGRDAVSPARYQQLQELERIADRERTAGRPIKPGLEARIMEIRDELDALPYHLFRKIALYRDLYFRSKLINAAGEPLQLPFGLTPDEIATELARLHGLMKASQHRAAIEESLRRHYRLVKTVRDGLLARGYIIPEELRNPLYFPHLVIDKQTGKLTRVKLDAADDFRGYLQQLVGTESAIDTDYLTAMYHHIATVFAHNRREDIVDAYWKPYDIKERLEKELKQTNAERLANGLGPLSLRQITPKGYVSYSVDRRIPLRPGYLIDHNRLAHRLGLDLADGDLQEQLRKLGLAVSITVDDIKEALIAGDGVQWIVPEPVAKALQGITDRQNRNAAVFERLSAPSLSAWKRYTLYAPQNVFRYTYGNVVSDLEKLFSVDPKVFSYLPQAWREVRAFRAGGEPSADLRAAWEEGVLTTVTAGEANRLAQEKAQAQMNHFEMFLTSPQALLAHLRRKASYGVEVNEVREAAFRYAKFKADIDRMRSGRKPVYAGAYWKDIEAISEDTQELTMAAKAAEIAKATFVDYQNISVNGDWLRRHLVPFYSWIEGNFRYHANLFRNLGDMSVGAGAAQVARGTAAAVSRVLVARSVAGVLLRLYLPYIAIQAWNNSGDREEIEKEIGDDARRRLHLVIGRDERGRPKFVYLPTAFGDFAKWFGGQRFAALADDYIEGKIDFPHFAWEFLVGAGKDNVNNLVGGFRPELKAGAVALFRQRLGPDFFDRRTVPDYEFWPELLGSMVDPVAGEMIARMLNGPEYYPRRKMGELMSQAILQIRRRDPEAVGYYALMDRIDAYGVQNPGAVTSFSGSSDDPLAALKASFRRALRAADVPGALTIYQQLLDAGYTAEKFRAMVDGSPLDSVKKEHRQPFLDNLSEAERRDVNLAFRYHQRLQAFRRRERQIFPSERASASYRQQFAAQGGRPDVFAGIMLDADEKTDEEEILDAARLLRQSLRR